MLFFNFSLFGANENRAGYVVCFVVRTSSIVFGRSDLVVSDVALWTLPFVPGRSDLVLFDVCTLYAVLCCTL